MTRAKALLMLRQIVISATLLAGYSVLHTASARTGSRVEFAEPAHVDWFVDAEQSFQPPDERWFYNAQQALREEATRVSQVLDAQGEVYATAWKTHLRWHLLEKNLGSLESVQLDEVRLVRRWMYSNRKGTEYPLFAALRENMDEYLDAVFTFSHEDLHNDYLKQVALARKQSLVLSLDPNHANAVALGRTLGWFEQTGQLRETTAAVRERMSLPNAQVVFGNPLIERLFATQVTDIEQTIPVAETMTAPPAGMLRNSRSLAVRGTASCQGSVSLELVPNEQVAAAKLVYQGRVKSHTRADAGPVTLSIHTVGPIEATKEIYLSPKKLDMGKTSVHPQVTATLRKITGRSAIARRIAARRANNSEARSFRQKSARSTTVARMKEQMDKMVATALDDMKSDMAGLRESMGEFQDVVAPLSREGAAPELRSTSSTQSEVAFNAFKEGRLQFGAASPCPIDSIEADLLVRVHVSFFNNIAETILGGKRLSDAFLMKYAKVLQAELPVALMVHSRAPRWAVVTPQFLPLELQIPSRNKFRLVFRVDQLLLNGQTFDYPTTASIDYSLVLNEYGEYQLERRGDVQLDSKLPTAEWDFLQKKLSAFFAPLLDGGGVLVPDGGVLGFVNHLKPKGVVAENEWLVAGVDVPQEVIDLLMEKLGR